MHPDMYMSVGEPVYTQHTPDFELSLFNEILPVGCKDPDLLKNSQILKSKDDRVFEVVVASEHLNSFKPPVSRQNLPCS